MKTKTFQNPRGSVMLLVVVVLVLMAMIGTAYLQVARLDRVATAQLTTNNIDIVAAAVTSYISDVLKNDLLDSTETFLFVNGEDEPYDYPWTDPSVSYPVRNNNGGLLGNAQGGRNDDTWLASTEPDFSGTDDVWPHLTDLTGVLLRIRKDQAQPDEYPASNTSYLRADTNVKIASATNSLSIEQPSGSAWTLGADADGDGVLDSRWEWAPIRQISGISYVMAVRIVDNSAMLNANVALSQVTALNTYDVTAAGANAPQWTTPSELDFGNFLYALGGTSTALRGYLKYRLGLSSLAASSLVPYYTNMTTPEVRWFYWLAGPAMYGNFNGVSLDPGLATSYLSLTVADELELRYRNGLNNHSSTTNIENVSNGLETFLRATTATETIYTDVPGVTSIQTFFENEPRHQMTAFSGAAIYAPTLKNLTSSLLHNSVPLTDDASFVFKHDLNVLLDTAAATPNPDLTTLSTEIRKVIERHPPGPANFYWPANASTATTPTEKQTFANQLAVNLADYVDDDANQTKLTEYKGAFGLEAMPFITEVYRQRAYVAQWKLISDNGTPANTTDDTVGQVWTQTGSTGYAIELRNPFRRVIQLKGLYLKFGSGPQQPLETLTGQTSMAVDEVIVIYTNPGGTSHADLATESGLMTGTTTKVNLATVQTSLETNTTSTLELLVDTTDTVNLQITYQKITLAAMDDSSLTGPTPTPIVGSAVTPYDSSLLSTTPPATPALPSPNEAYKQMTHLGNGNGLNMLTIIDTGFVSRSNPVTVTDLPVDTATYSAANYSALGQSDKTGVPYSGPANIMTTFANQQILMPNMTMLDQVGELAQVTIFGPTTTNPIPEAWAAVAGGSPTDVSNLMLDLMNTDYVGTGNNAIPHAAILLDRFTTLSPAVDTADNDGDGADTNSDGFNDTNIDNDPAGISPDPEQDELFVPGLININTAPAHLLQQILPIPDTTMRTNAVNALVDWRDGTATRPTNWRSGEGFAFTGEIQQALKTALVGLEQDASDTHTLNSTVVDFNNATTSTSDGIVDDREEELTLSRWLGQVASTRSDIFTAYILVKGYPAGDFRLGAVESKRLLVVFDRSGIVTGTEPVKVLGVFEVN